MQTLRLVKEGRVAEGATRYTDPGMVYMSCQWMAQMDREYFVALHLDQKMRIIADEVISIGSLNTTVTAPREVFKAAVHNGSAALIVVHNHPSGDPTPSKDDSNITERLKAVGDIIGIPLIDHVIIGDGAYFSIERSQLSSISKHAADILIRTEKIAVLEQPKMTTMSRKRRKPSRLLHLPPMRLITSRSIAS